MFDPMCAVHVPELACFPACVSLHLSVCKIQPVDTEAWWSFVVRHVDRKQKSSSKQKQRVPPMVALWSSTVPRTQGGLVAVWRWALWLALALAGDSSANSLH